jgi:integrase
VSGAPQAPAQPRRQRRTKANAEIITDVEIRSVAPGDVLTIGGGLTFRATGRNEATGKTFGRWTYRYQSTDPEFIAAQERKGAQTRQREKGLGTFPEVRLKAARLEAARLAAIVRAGVDPLEQERRDAAAALAAARVVRLTFAEAVRKYLDVKLEGFRNSKHRDQWRSTLDTYAAPIIGAMDVQSISTADVLRTLQQEVRNKRGEVEGPLWAARAETASRLRGRIESVLAWATVSGFRSGENPARWAGNLKELLPARSKGADEGNQPALALRDAPRWFAALRQRDGMGARALEFAALTAARSGEVRGAMWTEIDLPQMVWIIPARRMKAGREHRVPLTVDAAALLEALPRQGDNPLVFAAVRGGQLSDMTLSATMRRMHESAVADAGGDAKAGYVDPDSKRPAVPHGLRSSFRSWAGERGYQRELAEIALAHQVGNAVEQAYARSDLLERRRDMMVAWGDFLGGREAKSSDVIRFPSGLTG